MIEVSLIMFYTNSNRLFKLESVVRSKNYGNKSFQSSFFILLLKLIIDCWRKIPHL